MDPEQGSIPVSKSKSYLDVQTILEIGVALSMALLLAFFLRKIFLAPASVPLYYITYRKGPGLGILACLVFAFITMPLAMANLPHPIVFLENPLEYLVVGIAGFFPMKQSKNTSFKDLFIIMSRNGICDGFKKLKQEFFSWLYDTRGIIISAILRYIVVVLGSAVYIFTFWRFEFLPSILASMIMEWKAAFPGLIFFMVVVPILVRYRMNFREYRKPHEYNFREASKVTDDTGHN